MDSNILVYRMSEIKKSVYWQKIFTKLSQRFGFDVEYLVCSGLWVSFGHIFTIARGFLMALILTHFLSSQVFGQYNWLVSILGIISVFSLSGIGIAITQAVARGKEGAYRQGFLLSLKWGALGGIVLLGLALFYYLWKGEGQFGMTFFLMAFLFPFYTTSFLSRAFWGGKKRFDVLTKQRIVIAFCSLLVMGSAAVLFNNLTYQIVAFLLSTILFEGFFTVRALKFINTQNDEKLSTFARQRSNMNIISLITFNFDYFVIPFFVGFELFAPYVLAMSIAAQLKGIFKLLSSIIFPKLADRDFQSASRLLKRYLGKIIFSAICLGVILVYLLPILIDVFFPSDYSQAAFYVQILILAIALQLPVMFINQFFNAQKMVTVLYKITFFNLILKIALLLPLLYWWHLTGAAIAFLIFRIIVLIFMIFLFWRVCEKSKDDKEFINLN